MPDKLCFRWLGAGGVELAYGGETLLVDPFFTRPPIHKLLCRIQPDCALIGTHITRADYLLITHSHYDHLMDAPEALRLTGARAYGSANACALLRILEVPDGQVDTIQTGQQLNLGAFQVEVLPGAHIWLPVNLLVNGALAPGLKPPLRPVDYRMDACFSFRIQAGGTSLLLGKHPIAADVLLTYADSSRAHYQRLLAAVKPRLFIPIHWDDFFQPLTRPLRPILRSPWPALMQRLELHAFQPMVAEMSPQTRVLVPEIFTRYEISKVIAI